MAQEREKMAVERHNNRMEKSRNEEERQMLGRQRKEEEERQEKERKEEEERKQREQEEAAKRELESPKSRRSRLSRSTERRSINLSDPKNKESSIKLGSQVDETARSRKKRSKSVHKQIDLLQRLRARKLSRNRSPATIKHGHENSVPQALGSPRHLVLDSITPNKSTNSKAIPQLEQFQLADNIKKSLKRKRHMTNNFVRNAKSFSTVSNAIKPTLTIE